MSAFTFLLLAVYAAGYILIGVPMAFWSLRAWRKRNGKKNPALVFLFPLNCLILGKDALRQGIGTYERGGSLLHMMVSETDLLNAPYNEDSRLSCARYIFVSAFTWPLRVPYLIVLVITTHLILGGVAMVNAVLTGGAKLILACTKHPQY